MSTEDRVRAATRARAGLVRQVRPLELPDELPARGRRISRARPARPAYPARPGRHWLNWGAPLAAAALVTALALALVLLRQAPPPPSCPVAPTSAPPAAAAIPRYYVALAYGSAGSGMKAVVGDDQTGRTVAVLNPTAAQNFYGVTGAADDRTFVVMNYTNSTQETTWYLLRLTPGAAHPTQLTQAPHPADRRPRVNGLALSPDGRELAVMWRIATTADQRGDLPGGLLGVVRCRTAHLGHQGRQHQRDRRGRPTRMSLAWVDGDRSLDFRWEVTTAGTGGAPRSWTDTIRTHRRDRPRGRPAGRQPGRRADCRSPLRRTRPRLGIPRPVPVR